ncbi:hypothetical protein MLD38_025351 [Melastoma candidum]|uniref:Uncharacterized protein n=1 Tax=Melastoma candidum TaxID=119954 RepID=A0ACB9NYL2_9MYRT|nr:hypothetical protein MLD38_025351 [Melastoma candidum]
MKREMTKRFLPERYRHDLFIILNLLQQSSSVSEYTREFEQLMFQCDIVEPTEQTIARYIKGLKTHVADAVELHPYWIFADEREFVLETNSSSSSRTPISSKNKDKAQVEVRSAPNSDVSKRCFKCQGVGHIASERPNRRTVTIMELSEDDKVFGREGEPIWDGQEEVVKEPNDGELLVIQKTLNANVVPDEVD